MGFGFFFYHDPNVGVNSPYFPHPNRPVGILNAQKFQNPLNK